MKKDDLLIAIDFQNVYLPEQEWACPTIRKALENSLDILRAESAPEYILTMFLAPEKPLGTWKNYNTEYREINENQFLCSLVEELNEFAQDSCVAEKSTYSSMKCPEVLSAARGKRRIVLTGVVAECCVLATLLDAIDMGYEVVYLYDCISGQTEENEEMVRRIAESFSPIHTTVMSSKEYLAE